MTIRRDKPNAPPPTYDQRWEYWFWDYVNQNLGTGTFSTFASLPFLAAAGDALGTSSTGTLTLALSTTGVTAGSYGGTAGVPRFDISAAGRVTSATNVAVEVQAPILLTKGTGTLQFSINTSGVAAGTYGKNDYSARITINDKGIITAATEVAITGGTGTGIGSAEASVTAPIIFSVGTGTGAVLQPFTIALATTGVGTGTYGAPAAIPRFNIDNFGRVLTATAVGTLAALALGTGDPAGTYTAGDIFGLIHMRRLETSLVGGQINFARAADGSAHWAVGVLGTGTSPNDVRLRIVDLAGTLTPIQIRRDSIRITSHGTFLGDLSVGGTATGVMSHWGTATGGFSRWGTGTLGVLQANTGTLVGSLQVGTAVSTNAQILNVRGLARFGRNDAAAEGAQINLERAFDGTSHWAIDVAGTGTAASDVVVRFIDLVAGVVPLQIQRSSIYVTSHGTFLGNLNVGGTGTFGSVRAADLGTMARFDLYAAAGAVTGTSTTGTLTAVFNPNPNFTGTATAARFSGEGIVPTGCMLDYAGTASPPTGWLLCDGTAASRTTYADLFGVIGTIWGTGDGATTFNLPDTRRRVSVGFGGTAVGTLGTAVGSTGGVETVTLGTSQMPVHTHVQDSHNHTQDAHGHTIDADCMFKEGTEFGYDSGLFGFSTSSSGIDNTTATNQATTATNQNAGEGAAHENMQPSYVVQKIIKT